MVAVSMVCFNPSIGLTSVPTVKGYTTAFVDVVFQSLDRAYKRSDREVKSSLGEKKLFQSLDRAYKRSDLAKIKGLLCNQWFQSLDRAYKRSDTTNGSQERLSGSLGFNPSIGLTSVPTPFQSR